jgi:hypothetical protein
MQRDIRVSIEASEWEIERQLSDYWQVKIKWQITNLTDGNLYAVLTRPRPILTGEDVLLDHSAPDQLEDLYFNQPPRFRVATIPAHHAFMEWLPATLPVKDSTDRVKVVGRFAYSDVAANPDWEKTANWQQLGKWQTKVESPQFTVERQQ